MNKKATKKFLPVLFFCLSFQGFSKKGPKKYRWKAEKSGVFAIIRLCFSIWPSVCLFESIHLFESCATNAALFRSKILFWTITNITYGSKTMWDLFVANFGVCPSRICFFGDVFTFCIASVLLRNHKEIFGTKPPPRPFHDGRYLCLPICHDSQRTASPLLFWTEGVFVVEQVYHPMNLVQTIIRKTRFFGVSNKTKIVSKGSSCRFKMCNNTMPPKT